MFEKVTYAKLGQSISGGIETQTFYFYSKTLANIYNYSVRVSKQFATGQTTCSVILSSHLNFFNHIT